MTNLITIGELAKKAGIRKSKARFYFDQGLIKSEDRTESGYNLFSETEGLKRLKEIDRLQKVKRLRIKEIKEAIK